MSYLITSMWMALTSAGLLLDGPIFNVAVASMIIICVMFVLGMLFSMGCIATKRYDAINDIPKRNRFQKTVSTIVDISPGIVIASIGHPVLGAGYICLYGIVKINAGICSAAAVEK